MALSHRYLFLYWSAQQTPTRSQSHPRFWSYIPRHAEWLSNHGIRAKLASFRRTRVRSIHRQIDTSPARSWPVMCSVHPCSITVCTSPRLGCAAADSSSHPLLALHTHVSSVSVCTALLGPAIRLVCSTTPFSFSSYLFLFHFIFIFF